MLKIILALLITIKLLIVLLMILFLSGTNIRLPGLGVVVSGSFISLILLVIELVLIGISFVIFRRLRRDFDRLA